MDSNESLHRNSSLDNCGKAGKNVSVQKVVKGKGKSSFL